MKRFVPLLLATSAFLLAACGGGGGGTPPTNNGGGPSPTPTNTPTLAPSTTNASGVVVDDSSGAPLPGVKVALMPWAPCGPTPAPATAITPSNDGCPTPLPSPQATTDPSGNFTLSAVANGHYILVIGNDVAYTPPPGYTPPSCTTNCGTPTPAPFVVQAVVHDNVTLTGGNQTLKAPTLPGNAYYSAPAWETNGDYRLATLNAQTEMPCYIAWQYLRAQNSLAGSSVDEWLTENVRADDQLQQKAPTGTSFTTLSIHFANTPGGTDCYNSMLTLAFSRQNPYALDSRSTWFGGQYLYYTSSTPNLSAYGTAEFPTDPRSNTDENQPIWP